MFSCENEKRENAKNNIRERNDFIDDFPNNGIKGLNISVVHS